MTVLLSAQHLDLSLHMVNLLKRLQNLGCDEKADKYRRDRRVTFDLMFGELCHYLMTLEHGPHNCGGLVHSGRTKPVPPHNIVPIQVIKNMPQLVR